METSSSGEASHRRANAVAKDQKPQSLADEVFANAGRKLPGFKSWFDRLDPSAQAELLEIKKRFDPASHNKNALARAIIESAKERGWHTAGRQGVIDWLERQEKA
jgi:hypothetical protein